jgi:hypothetical protein
LRRSAAASPAFRAARNEKENIREIIRLIGRRMQRTQMRRSSECSGIEMPIHSGDERARVRSPVERFASGYMTQNAYIG